MCIYVLCAVLCVCACVSGCLRTEFLHSAWRVWKVQWKGSFLLLCRRRLVEAWCRYERHNGQSCFLFLYSVIHMHPSIRYAADICMRWCADDWLACWRTCTRVVIVNFYMHVCGAESESVQTNEGTHSSIRAFTSQAVVMAKTVHTRTFFSLSNSSRRTNHVSYLLDRWCPSHHYYHSISSIISLIRVLNYYIYIISISNTQHIRHITYIYIYQSNGFRQWLWSIVFE